MLIVMEKSTHGENISQPLQTKKTFKVAIACLTGLNGIFKVTSNNNKLYSTTSIDEKDFTEITISSEVYDLKSLNEGIKWILQKTDTVHKRIYRS